MPPSLRPGKGAKATVLTRFIKPKQPMPDGNPKSKHRSPVIVLGHFSDDKGRCCFTLRFDVEDDGGDEADSLYAIRRYVKIVEEGPSEDLFDEELISWEDSDARKLLYKDLSEGAIPLNGTEADAALIYKMRDDYAKYDESMFAARLASLRDVVRKAMKRKQKDKEAFDKFVKNNGVSRLTFSGLPQWKSSNARALILAAIKDREHEKFDFRKMYTEEAEFHEFPFEYWRDRVKQEIGTAKYVHTLKVNNGKKLIILD
jgi:hypothetical protein